MAAQPLGEQKAGWMGDPVAAVREVLEVLDLDH